MVRKKSQSKIRSQKNKNNYRYRGDYSEIRIKNFRLFRDLKLSSLGKINLIFGPNNCGKTSLLEAIYSHAAGFNLGPFMGQVITKRQEAHLLGAFDLGDKIINLFRMREELPYRATITAKLKDDIDYHACNIIYEPSYEMADLNPRLLGQYSGTATRITSAEDYDTQDSITKINPITKKQIATQFIGRLIVTIDSKTKKFDLHYPPDFQSQEPFKLANMHDILSHRDPNVDRKIFGHLKRYGILKEFTAQIKEIFREIVEIDNIPYPDGSPGPLYIETVGGEKIPLYGFGDGLRRWFHLLGQMIVYKNAVHCIEEIDATFHPAAYNQLSKLLIKYSREFNNQLFITSHSLEFADAFLNALYGEDGCLIGHVDDFVRVFTLMKSEETGEIEVWPLSGCEAFEKRDRFKLELRGK